MVQGEFLEVGKSMIFNFGESNGNGGHGNKKPDAKTQRRGVNGSINTLRLCVFASSLLIFYSIFSGFDGGLRDNRIFKFSITKVFGG
jgi:hypothetical protein